MLRVVSQSECFYAFCIGEQIQSIFFLQVQNSKMYAASTCLLFPNLSMFKLDITQSLKFISGNYAKTWGNDLDSCLLTKTITQYSL